MCKKVIFLQCHDEYPSCRSIAAPESGPGNCLLFDQGIKGNTRYEDEPGYVVFGKKRRIRL